MAVSLRQMLVTGIMAALLAAGSLEAAPPAPPVVPVSADPVEAAVAKLKAEADQYFADKVELLLPITRPRPVVAAIPADAYDKVLSALTAKFSPDVAKDMYVRFHLMYVVNHALPRLEKPLDRAVLARLIKALPDDIQYTALEVYGWDPDPIGRRHFNLMQSCMVTVGFPPFQRRIPAPESFQYMSGAQLAKAKAAYAEAQSLEGKFKRVYNKPNDMYNRRMWAMDWGLRQFRGELYYAQMVKNPTGLELLTDAILRTAGTNPRRATDLACFLNMAYSNGVLATYEKLPLNAAARKLKSAVALADKASETPAVKAKPKEVKISTGWENYGQDDRWRNLGEALFSVITGIETDRIPPVIPPETYWRPLPPAEPRPAVAIRYIGTHTQPAKQAETQPFKIKPQDVTLADIEAAIARALPALENYRPPEADLGNSSYRHLNLPSWPDDLWRPGQGALSTWAMLSSGEPPRAGWMQRRVNWVLGFDSANTYDRAMRLQMITMLPPSEKKAIVPWVKRDTSWLIETMTEHGGWDAQNTGIRSTGYGDNANSQYAMLGLWGASQAAYEVPNAVWQKVDQFWREGQRPPGAPGDGAWAVTSSAELKKGANLKAFTNQVSASMTAGGVLSLYLTESFLYGEKRADVGQTLSPELLRGIAWLDQNFSLDKLDGDSDLYYYTWTIQNVGQSTGYRTFNKIDWYRETTARLLNTQGLDGLWDGPKGKNVSTSFALLYLYRAKGPLAICKLKIDSVPPAGGRPAAKEVNWNNRPNDLYNFARDMTRRTEVPTSWQIADLDQPVYQLIESPVLYLATNTPFKLSAAHTARLKEYLAAGGMLVCVPEGKQLPPVIASMKALAAELCPLPEGKEPISRQMADKHPFYTLFATVSKNIPTVSYENSLRPLVVVVERDIGQDLQMNRIAQREAFDLLGNLYLYATGRNAKRSRIATNYVTQKNMSPKKQLAVARIKYGGEYDPEPLAMPQLKALMANDYDVDLKVSTVAAGELTKEMKVAFLTLSEGEGPMISEQDAASLKKWVEDGGTLWIDAAGGNAAAIDKVNQLLPKVGMTDFESLQDHPIVTGKITGGFNNTEPELRPFLNTRADRAQLRGKLTGTHANVLAVNGDLSAGLAGVNHWGIAGFTAKSARQLVVNSLLCAVRENAPPATAPATAPATRPATMPAVKSPRK